MGGFLANLENARLTYLDRWVRTGDEVIVNEKNEIFIVDRIKVRLCSSSFNVVCDGQVGV